MKFRDYLGETLTEAKEDKRDWFSNKERTKAEKVAIKRAEKNKTYAKKMKKSFQTDTLVRPALKKYFVTFMFDDGTDSERITVDFKDI